VPFFIDSGEVSIHSLMRGRIVRTELDTLCPLCFKLHRV
jgi:hypothetical protein